MRLEKGSVWLDAQGTQSVAYAERGIARYIAEQIRALTQIAPGLIGSVRLDPSFPIPTSLDFVTGEDILEWRGDEPATGFQPPAVFHITSPFESEVEIDALWPEWARAPEVRTVVTLYDLIPLIFRERYLDPYPAVNAVYTARLGLIRAADHVLTISRQTAEDAIERLGIPERRVTVIDSGVSSRLSSLIVSAAEAESVVRGAFPALRDGFMLYVGGDDPRKNLEGTIRAYSLLSEETRRAHQLAIVCRLSDERVAQLSREVASLGIDLADVVFTGFVSDRELAALYRSCGLFVFPSLYEGAGLPILEAMSCGAPVAASGTSSIPEILGDGGARFDPSDPADIAACLERVLASPAEGEDLRTRSAERVALYTWERVAERTLEGYERALDDPRPSRSRPRSRKRVAVFTPWPPQRSGVATHSRRIVEELAAHGDVDVVVPDDEPGLAFDRSLEPDVGIWAEADFDWVHGIRGYDRILYMLGGSRFHAHVFEALMKRPGVVLAHDVRLLGLYTYLQQNRFARRPNWMARRLEEMYGHRIPAQDLKRVWDAEVYVKHGVFMTHDVQAHAQRILVHSRYQADILRLESEGEPPPTAIVNHGIPPAPPELNGRAPRGDGPLIVSYGIVSILVKRIELLLEGFAALRASSPRARLQIVGEVSPEERVGIEQMITRLGLDGVVELSGRAEGDDYWRILSSADLAVQLRAGVNGGEASGAVCDCIAARVPTIVSAIGWFREVPDPVVRAIPEDCSAEALAREMDALLNTPGLRDEVRRAQDAYARENSFAAVAERYAELLEL